MPRELPPELRTGAFHVKDALDLGVTARRLRGADLEAPFAGVRASASHTDVRSRCLDYLPLLRPDEVFSHVTAAALWGLPLPLARGGGHALHVSRHGGQRPRRQGIIGHRSASPLGATFLHGLPVVTAVGAWAQCAEELELDELVAAGDALAGRWSPEAAARELPLAELEREVEARGSRRGARRLSEALGLIRPNVWSPKETELRLLLVRSGLPEPPALNCEFTADDGTRLGVADLAYPAHRLALEYEGDHHRLDRAQWRRDIVRRERFADAGWRQVRVTDDDLKECRMLVARIARHLRPETRR